MASANKQVAGASTSSLIRQGTFTVNKQGEETVTNTVGQKGQVSGGASKNIAGAVSGKNTLKTSKPSPRTTEQRGKNNLKSGSGSNSGEKGPGSKSEVNASGKGSQNTGSGGKTALQLGKADITEPKQKQDTLKRDSKIGNDSKSDGHKGKSDSKNGSTPRGNGKSDQNVVTTRGNKVENSTKSKAKDKEPSGNDKDIGNKEDVINKTPRTLNAKPGPLIDPPTAKSNKSHSDQAGYSGAKVDRAPAVSGNNNSSGVEVNSSQGTSGSNNKNDIKSVKGGKGKQDKTVKFQESNLVLKSETQHAQKGKDSGNKSHKDIQSRGQLNQKDTTHVSLGGKQTVTEKVNDSAESDVQKRTDLIKKKAALNNVNSDSSSQKANTRNGISEPSDTNRRLDQNLVDSEHRAKSNKPVEVTKQPTANKGGNSKLVANITENSIDHGKLKPNENLGKQYLTTQHSSQKYQSVKKAGEKNAGSKGPEDNAQVDGVKAEVNAPPQSTNLLDFKQPKRTNDLGLSNANGLGESIKTDSDNTNAQSAPSFGRKSDNNDYHVSNGVDGQVASNGNKHINDDNNTGKNSTSVQGLVHVKCNSPSLKSEKGSIDSKHESLPEVEDIVLEETLHDNNRLKHDREKEVTMTSWLNPSRTKSRASSSVSVRSVFGKTNGEPKYAVIAQNSTDSSDSTAEEENNMERKSSTDDMTVFGNGNGESIKTNDASASGHTLGKEKHGAAVEEEPDNRVTDIENVNFERTPDGDGNIESVASKFWENVRKTEEENEELKNDNLALSKAMIVLKDKDELSQREIVKLKEEIERLNALLKNMQEDKVKLSNEMSETKEQHKNVISAMEKEKGEMKKKAEEEIKKLGSEIQSSQESITKLQSDLASIVQKLSDEQKTNSQLKKTTEKLKEDYRILESEKLVLEELNIASVADIKQLKGNVEKLNKEIKALKEERDRLITDKELGLEREKELASQVDKIETLHKKVQKEKEEAEIDNRVLKSKIDELTVENESLKASEEKHKTKMKKLENNMKVLKEAEVQLSQLLLEKQDAIEKLHAHVLDLTKQLEEKRKDAKPQKKLEKKPTAQDREIQRLTEENKRLQAELEVKSESEEKNEAEVTRLKKELRKMTGNLGTANERILQLEGWLDDIYKKNGYIEDELESARSDVDRMSLPDVLHSVETSNSYVFKLKRNKKQGLKIHPLKPPKIVE